MSPEHLAGPAAQPRIGYVLKVYPRFSETFVVSEILAREARGDDITVFSLRAPAEPRFHEALARVKAPVRYIGRVRKPEEVWGRLREAAASIETPGAPFSRTVSSATAFSTTAFSTTATSRTAHSRTAHSLTVLEELLAADVSDAAQALTLAVQAREAGVTHLHAHFASVATTVTRLASLLTGIPYSFTAHAKDIFHESVVPADVAAKLRDAHHVVTISDYNADFLRREYADALRETPLHRIYNGLDLSSFQPREHAAAVASSFAAAAGGAPTDAGAPEVPAPEAPVVLGVGRLVAKKGFDVLIEAAGLLHRAGRQIRVRIVGDGDQRATLQARIDALGLDEVVTLTGPLPQQEVRCELTGASVFAAPCVVGPDGNADGLPTVLLEAMALGVPCVSTDVTGITEAIGHEVTGLQVDQHDATGLARAIERLLDDPAMAGRLVTAARDLVERRFDSRTQARLLGAALRGEPGPDAGTAPHDSAAEAAPAEHAPARHGALTEVSIA